MYERAYERFIWEIEIVFATILKWCQTLQYGNVTKHGKTTTTTTTNVANAFTRKAILCSILMCMQ